MAKKDKLINNVSISKVVDLFYDNAVAEATFKTFKTEFINDVKFLSLIQLKLELFDYINWYNNKRIHSNLNYLTPIKYQKQMSTKK